MFNRDHLNIYNHQQNLRTETDRKYMKYNLNNNLLCYFNRFQFNYTDKQINELKELIIKDCKVLNFNLIIDTINNRKDLNSDILITTVENRKNNPFKYYYNEEEYNFIKKIYYPKNNIQCEYTI